jgi:hypothetical protein
MIIHEHVPGIEFWANLRPGPWPLAPWPSLTSPTKMGGGASKEAAKVRPSDLMLLVMWTWRVECNDVQCGYHLI